MADALPTGTERRSPDEWPALEPPIIFSATRGDEQLHVQIVGGQAHPNPAMSYVLLEVRHGPDEPA